jgi:predicted nuclease of predicted toxin-antitoxin system
LFPESEQVRRLGLDQAVDHAIRQHAKVNGFTLVTQDSDFYDLVLVLGSPPKVIWLRCGNQPTEEVEKLLRFHAQAITALLDDKSASCLEIF